MQKNLLITGGNGLIGSKFIDLYSQTYQFEAIDVSHPTNPIDITDQDLVLKTFTESSASAVVHLAAFTNVTAAWQQQGDKNGLAYQVNVVGTKNIIEACRQTGKHLIHISTAYVFDGEKADLYTESDPLSPIEWYGQTKADAETAIQEGDINWTIFRIDQPFRFDTFQKLDVAHRIVQGLLDDSLYPQFTNHYFGPTVIEDFCQAIDWAIRLSKTGLYHASSGEKWSDYDFASYIKEVFKFPGKVTQGDLIEYLRTLDRPYQKNTALDASKLKAEQDFKTLTIKEAIQKLVY